MVACVCKFAIDFWRIGMWYPIARLKQDRRCDFDINIVFMGSPICARTCLEALVKYAPCRVAGIVTQRAKRIGRDWNLTETSCAMFAREQGIPCISPEDVNDRAVVAKIASWNPDVIVVVAYGQFLGRELLAVPSWGCVNCHFSLLPKYRGASPVAATILNGEAISGITLTRMGVGMDSGPLLVQRVEPLDGNDTTQGVTERLAIVGGASLARLVQRIAGGEVIGEVAQDADLVSVVCKLHKEDGLIDWTMSAVEIDRRIRAYCPWPGTWTYLPSVLRRAGSSGRLLIQSASVCSDGHEGCLKPGMVVSTLDDGFLVRTGCGNLQVLQVRPEGGRSMSGADFIRGRTHLVGRCFEGSH